MGELTFRQLDSLTATGRFTDGDGLILVFDSAGCKYLHLPCIRAGKRRDLSLGPVRTLSLREAREAARTARVEIGKGINPVAQRKVASVAGISFADAARTVHAEHRAAGATASMATSGWPRLRTMPSRR